MNNLHPLHISIDDNRIILHHQFINVRIINGMMLLRKRVLLFNDNGIKIARMPGKKHKENLFTLQKAVNKRKNVPKCKYIFQIYIFQSSFHYFLLWQQMYLTPL